MNTILISLIGRGNRYNGGGGYRKALYKFDDKYKESHETAFFGSELYKYLKYSGHNIDSWIIFGTETSAWSEIIAAIDSIDQEKYVEIYSKVNDAEKEGIKDSILNEWHDMLMDYIPGLQFIKVDPLDYRVYINALLQFIPDTNEYSIIFDMTHAYRHMPVLIAFSLMYLKHLKKINNIHVYYGALDMTRDNETPVLKIDFINELFKMSTSYESFKSSGYFPDILDCLGISNTESLYFQIEMNRNPRNELKETLKRLDKVMEGEDYCKYTAKSINDKLTPLVELDYLDERMAERAIFFYQRNQYLKALVLIYEAILVLAARKMELDDCFGYEARQKARKQIWHEIDYYRVIDADQRRFIKGKGMGEIFSKLEYTRNAAAHGTQAQGVQNYVEDPTSFYNLFKASQEMYESIKHFGI